MGRGVVVIRQATPSEQEEHGAKTIRSVLAQPLPLTWSHRFCSLVVELRKPGVLQRSCNIDPLSWVKLQHALQQVECEGVCVGELDRPRHTLRCQAWWVGQWAAERHVCSEAAVGDSCVASGPSKGAPGQHGQHGQHGGATQ